MYSNENTGKPRTPLFRPPLQAPRLLGQLRERLRYLHYSPRTEQTYVYWVRFFIHFSGIKHPRDMGKPEVEAFLTMLAMERKVSVSTHRQALSAILFLYKEVLGHELPWLQEIGRPLPKRRIPAVLTMPEVQRLLGFIDGETGLLARLLYGTGMRLMEGLSLRVKDIDFDRQAIVVREGKGAKDRVVMLPRSLQGPQSGTDIRTVQELLGHSDVSTTMIYTHVLKVAAGGTSSPLDALAPPQPSCREPHSGIRVKN